MYDSTTLSALILGISLIFSVLLIGYFVLLREWSVSKAKTKEIATRAALTSHDDLEFLRTLHNDDLKSPEYENRS